MKAIQLLVRMMLLEAVIFTAVAFSQSPTITSFAPASGPVGTAVTITGTNFDPAASNNVVYFGATKGTVTGATSTSLTVTVPVGATYKPISVTVNGLTAYSAQPFVVTFTPHWAGDPLAFDARVDFGIESNCGGIVVQDFDGDGKPDVAVSNTTANTISVFRNISTTGTITAGSFAPKVDIAVGCVPGSMVVGDFDGDGKVDLAFLMGTPSGLFAVLRNTSTPGVISFESAGSYALTGIGAVQLVAGDIDGDGKCDLTAGSDYWHGGDVLIKKNTSTVGNISFEDGYRTGSSTNGLALCDIDGDGKPDILSAWTDVTVFRNLSTPGSFSFAAVNLSAVGDVREFAVGDLDGDGKPDIVASFGGGVICLWRNTSTPGTITTDTRVDLPGYEHPGSNYYPALSDLTGDGKLDLVVVNRGGSLGVYRNTSTPGVINTTSFAPKVDLTVGTNPSNVELADIDGDGVPDIVVSNNGSNCFSVIRNKFAEKRLWITSFTPTSGPVGTVVTITGTNFDPVASNNLVYFGATKGTVTGATSTSLTVTVPVGATYKPISVTVNGLTAYSAQPFVVTFTPHWAGDPLAFDARVDFGIESNCGGIVVQDFDGDGKPDVAVSNTTANTISVFRNISTTGTITAGSFAPKVDIAVGCVPVSLVAGDFDGDGKVDLAWLVGTNASALAVLRNTGTPGTISFESGGSYALAGLWLNYLTVGDVDGDGRTDLVGGSSYGTGHEGILIKKNTSTVGNISFVDGLYIVTDSYDLTLRDIDGDGKPDIIAGHGGNVGVNVLRNLSTPGSLSFAPPIAFSTVSDVVHVAVGDLDGDGKPDIVGGIFAGGVVSVWHNTSTVGSFTFESKIDLPGYTWMATNDYPVLSDLNGDGKLDIVISNHYGSVGVYRNTSTPGLINTSSFAAKVDYTVGAGPTNVELADIDGDGVPDIVCSNSTGQSFSVLRNSKMTISATWTGSGVVTPSGEVKVVRGTDATFSIMPRTGYLLARVLVDSTDQGAVSSYTFRNVTANHTIAATFIPWPLDVYVDPSYNLGNCGGHLFGYDAFSTIQPAIDIVAAGGTVHIASGTYSENLSIIKTISLLGAGAATTIVNGGGGGACVTVTGLSVRISGLGFTGSAGNGVVIQGNGTRLTNCWSYGNSANGVYVNGASYCFLQGNTIYSNGSSSSGILLQNATQNTIAGNNLYGGMGWNIRIIGSGQGAARGNIIQANRLAGPAIWNVEVNSDPFSTKVNFNVFTTTPYGKYVANTAGAFMLDAQYNWFDGQDPASIAGGLSGTVNITGWFATAPTVTIVPTTYYMKPSTPVTLVAMCLIPAGTYVKGYSIQCTWNDAVTHRTAGPYEGTFLNGQGGLTTVNVDTSTAGTTRVDGALLSTGGVGNASGTPYVGTLFSMDFLAASEGSSPFGLPRIVLRDPSNVTIPLNPSAPPPGTVVVDGHAPLIQNVAIGNVTVPDNHGYFKNGDRLTVSATITDANPLGAGNMTANLTNFFNLVGHTADFATSYATSNGGTLWDFTSATSNPRDNTITVVVTATDLAGNTSTGSAGIISDNTPPDTSAVTNLYASAGWGKVNLHWTENASGDPTYRGAVIRYNRWNGYPLYSIGAPSYPTGGLPDGAGSVSAVAVPKGTTAALHDLGADNAATRDIYYYAAYAVDYAGNAALSSSATERSTSYLLGDLGAGTGTIPGTGYDGRVNFDDLNFFAPLYFSANASWNSTNNGAQANIGPTVSNNRGDHPDGDGRGIPRPNGLYIGFEDLMIFAMNWYQSVPKLAAPPSPVIAGSLEMQLRSNRPHVNQGETFAVTVYLAGDGHEVKGYTTALAFDQSVVEVTGVTRGSLFGNEQQSLFMQHSSDGKLVIAGALFGTEQTVTYSGDLAIVRFRGLSQGDPAIVIQSATVRSGKNSDRQVTTENNVAEVPTSFSLDQNYPNPFNPATTIGYGVPKASPVTIEIYNMLGQRVATLVNQTQEAGYYKVVWSGRNDARQQVASGMYLFKMSAGDFKSVRKMLLLK